MERQAGNRSKELLPESIEGPKRYSVSDPPHGVKVEAEIMQGVKGARRHFSRHIEMPQIGAGMGPARIARARRIHGSLVFRILRVPDVETAFARKQLSGPRVARRQHAVEHVDAARDALPEVLGRAGAHQIARLRLGEAARGLAGDVIHKVDRLADAQSSDRVALEADPDGGLGALVAQVLENPTLHDAELRLPGVGGPDVTRLAVANLLEPRATPRGPAHRAFHRSRRFVLRRGEREALVEDHRDVGAQARLDVRRAFRRQQVWRAVEVRPELRALFRNLAPLRETEHLVAAAVGQHGMRPADEAVQAPAPGDQLVAGTQIQVIGVAEDHLRACLLEVTVAHGLDASLRAHGHERGGLDDPVGRAKFAEASGTVTAAEREAEPIAHATIRFNWFSGFKGFRGFPAGTL